MSSSSGLAFLVGKEVQLFPNANLARPTLFFVFLVPPFVDELVQNLSDAVGFDVETLSYLLGMLLCYPLGMILNSMPFGKARHFFSFLLGAFLLQFTIGVQWIHHLISSLAVYAMFIIVPRSKVQIVVPAFVMIYMTLGHLHRQYINYLGWDLDFTGAQMVLTQKLYMMVSFTTVEYMSHCGIFLKEHDLTFASTTY